MSNDEPMEALEWRAECRRRLALVKVGAWAWECGCCTEGLHEIRDEEHAAVIREQLQDEIDAPEEHLRYWVDEIFATEAEARAEILRRVGPDQ